MHTKQKRSVYAFALHNAVNETESIAFPVRQFLVVFVKIQHFQSKKLMSYKTYLEELPEKEKVFK